MAQSPPGNTRKGDPLSKRSYTLKLTFSTLVTVCIVLIIGIVWSFVMGVMVGRGYNPEKRMPQLATLLPDEEGRTSPAQRETLGNQLPKAEVMKPEELRYSSKLKGKPGQPATEPAHKNMQNATAPVTAPPPVSAAAATAEGTGTPAPAGIVEQTKPKPKPEPDQELFDFVFQVATFKDEGSVDKLRARLEGRGLRSRMDRDGKLLKVMVLLRGSNEQAQGLRQTMLDMNLGQSLLRSKTAVKQRTKR